MLFNIRIKAFWYAKDYSAINSEMIHYTSEIKTNYVLKKSYLKNQVLNC